MTDFASLLLNPYFASLGIPVLAVLITVCAKLLIEEKGDASLETCCAGLELMIAAIVAVPGLIIARALGLGTGGDTSQVVRAIQLLSGSAVVVLAILFLGCVYEKYVGRGLRKQSKATGLKQAIRIAFGVVAPTLIGAYSLLLVYGSAASNAG
jgi:hypothetical protein